MYAYPAYPTDTLDPRAEAEVELDLYLLDMAGILDEDDCICSDSDLDYYGCCVCGCGA